MNEGTALVGIRVAVSQNVDYVAERGEWRDFLDQRLAVWLIKLGALPIPVPNLLLPEPGLRAWLESVAPGAIVLSGGNDLGEHGARDNTETSLIAYAEGTELPLLGICRGMQMMAHYAGTGLEPVVGHAGTRHALNSAQGGGFPKEVNSFHNWSLARCPTGYSVVAESEDGSIEAIRHREFGWEGWMWHPEREKPFNRSDIERARHLLGVT